AGPGGRTGITTEFSGNETKNKEAGSMTAERPNPDQWARVKQRLRTELGEDIFNSWFARVEFEEADKATVYLSVPTRFLKSWILAHYIDRILALWQEERSSIARV